METVKRLVEWWKRTRVARALGRYGTANGALLAGGISFSALFSIFAALVIGFTVFMAVLGDNEQLRDAVLEQLDEVLPGIVDTGEGGLVTPDQLQLTTAGGIAGVIAVLVLLNTAITVMTSLRSGVRAMFGMVRPKENPALGMLRDLGGFAVLGLGIILTAALGVAAGTMATWLLDMIGLGDAPFVGVLLRALGLLVALVIDTFIFIFIYRGLAGARPTRRDLVIGAIVAGIAAGVLRVLGTSAVGAVDNPLLASFAAIITLLLWVNLQVRIVLMVAAWTANPPKRFRVTQDMITHYDEVPNYVTVSAPHTLTWDHDPVTGRVIPIIPEPDPAPESEQPYWGGLIGRIRDSRRARQPQQPDPAELAAEHQAPKDLSDPSRPKGAGRAERSDQHREQKDPQQKNRRQKSEPRTGGA